MRRLSLGSFVVGAGIVMFFLGFNWLIPFLRAPADAGGDANQGLNRLSSAGAIAFPIGVGLMGLGYLGIILSPRVRQTGRCPNCGYDLRGCREPRCPACGSIYQANAGRRSSPDTYTPNGDHALKTEHHEAGIR